MLRLWIGRAGRAPHAICSRAVPAHSCREPRGEQPARTSSSLEPRAPFYTASINQGLPHFRWNWILDTSGPVLYRPINDDNYCEYVNSLGLVASSFYNHGNALSCLFVSLLCVQEASQYDANDLFVYSKN
ncbi:unnamed protein product [Spodoptera exigua]|nr:unnamed protein product [Spodoptera exigua]